MIDKVKQHVDSLLDSQKARLVAQGNNQRSLLDYAETFSTVAKPVTIRVILCIALSKGWPVRQLDVNNAFLNGKLHEDVYMIQLPGFTNKAFLLAVCHLHKALYGLKQAPRVWFHKLFMTLSNLGFVAIKLTLRCSSDDLPLHSYTCLYISTISLSHAANPRKSQA